MRPPLYTDSDPNFLEAVGYIVCLSAVVSGLMLSFFILKENRNHPGDTGFVAPYVEDYSDHCKKSAPENFNQLVEEAGEFANVNPRVIALTVYRESGCNPLAVGAAGEVGLGQVYPSVWGKTLIDEGIIDSVGDLYDPQVNLRAVGFILSESLKYAKGDPIEAVRRYNGSGPAAYRYAEEQSSVYRRIWEEPLWLRGG